MRSAALRFVAADGRVGVFRLGQVSLGPPPGHGWKHPFHSREFSRLTSRLSNVRLLLTARTFVAAGSLRSPAATFLGSQTWSCFGWLPAPSKCFRCII